MLSKSTWFVTPPVNHANKFKKHKITLLVNNQNISYSNIRTFECIVIASSSISGELLFTDTMKIANLWERCRLSTLRVECPNAEFCLVRIWTLFTQCKRVLVCGRRDLESCNFLINNYWGSLLGKLLIAANWFLLMSFKKWK